MEVSIGRETKFLLTGYLYGPDRSLQNACNVQGAFLLCLAPSIPQP